MITQIVKLINDYNESVYKLILNMLYSHEPDQLEIIEQLKMFICNCFINHPMKMLKLKTYQTLFITNIYIMLFNEQPVLINKSSLSNEFTLLLINDMKPKTVSDECVNEFVKLFCLYEDVPSMYETYLHKHTREIFEVIYMNRKPTNDYEKWFYDMFTTDNHHER